MFSNNFSINSFFLLKYFIVKIFYTRKTVHLPLFFFAIVDADAQFFSIIKEDRERVGKATQKSSENKSKKRINN